MKKTLTLLLVILMAAALLTGCGSEKENGNPEESVKTIDSIKTLGDVIALEGENKQSATYEGMQIYVFQLGETYYRVRAEIPEDLYQAVWDADFEDEEQMEKLNERLAPFEITEIENLNEQILTEDEMKALAGKTGQELMDAGWYISGYNLETMEVWMNYGPFLYTVCFDGHVPEEEWDTFNDEAIGEMTVKSVEFMMLGDATNIE